MARALIADPDFPRKAQTGNHQNIRPCVSCLSDCSDKGVSGIGRCCTVNPFAGQEHSHVLKPINKSKRILIVGGGPSGIQAAIMADKIGCKVELWEKDRKLGGPGTFYEYCPL